MITNLNNYLKDDLPNALKYIRVSEASIKRRHLKQIAGHINDFLFDQSSQFFSNQWYLMALYIIETKLFKVGFLPSKKNLLLALTNSPSKMIKKTFYFIVKALSILKIFKLLSWLFGHVEKTA